MNTWLEPSPLTTRAARRSPAFPALERWILLRPKWRWLGFVFLVCGGLCAFWILAADANGLALGALLGFLFGQLVFWDYFGSTLAYRLTRDRSRLQILCERWAVAALFAVPFFAVAAIVVNVRLAGHGTPTALTGLGGFLLAQSVTRPRLVWRGNLGLPLQGCLVFVFAFGTMPPFDLRHYWLMPVIDVALAVPLAIQTVRIWKRADF